METAPLVLAHSHARNASTETHKANPLAASEEHDLAAGEFATAASHTADTEALRTLGLLEQHHQKLAELLKVKPEEAQTVVQTSSSSGALLRSSNSSANFLQSGTRPVESSPRQVPLSPQTASPVQHRELSSSIASNLASARGIPSNRPRRGNQSLAQISTQTAEGRVLRPSRKSNLGEHEIRASAQNESANELLPTNSHTTKRRPNISQQTNPTRPVPVSPPPTSIEPVTEDSFTRFYATFGNLISTISAPLAFAGLPLGPDVHTKGNEDSQNKSESPASSRVAADPDLARYFSRAALRAVRDEHGGFNSAESFYVVPTTGGTMSYAGMLSNTRQGSSLTEEDESEFVDASETPQPASPSHTWQREPKSNSVGRHQAVKGGKSWEELAVENETLKAVVLDLGDRLRAFELGAQRSSRALHASVRGLSSPTGSVNGGNGVPPLPGVEGMKVLQEKLKENEVELKSLKKENKRLGRENQKFIGVIERYRERWEMLKVNARERVKVETSGARAQGDPEE